MQKYRIAAIMLGGLFLASPAMAQSANLAYATGEPRSEYMVFLEKGNVLPESATPLVSKAAKAAMLSTTPVETRIKAFGSGPIANGKRMPAARKNSTTTKASMPWR